MWIALVTLLTSLAPVQSIAAPIQDPLEHFAARERGLELARHGDAQTAAPILAAITRSTPGDGEAWLRLASCRYRLGSYADAALAFERALELGSGTANVVHYDLACCHALLGRTDEAFAALDRALAGRFEDRPHLARDADLAALHDDPRWPEAAGLLAGGDLSPAEGWRLDLLHLKKEMERLHVDVGQAAPSAEIDAAVDELYALIPKLPEHRIPVRMQRIVRMLGDGHSVVYPVSRRVPPTQLPFRFYWFPAGLFVVEAAEGFEQWVGHRVAGIGDTTADRFHDDLKDLVTRDNDMGILWMGPLYLLFPAVLHDLGYVDSIERVALKLEDPGGTVHELTVEPVPMRRFRQRLVQRPGAEPPLYLRSVDDEYWYEVLEDGVLYVQFNRVVDKAAEPLAAFTKRLREVVDEQEIDHLILDVRHNNGGVSYLSTELLRSLVHFETTRDGRLYVLIGRNTYSAAQMFITDVERLTGAIFVGEPSGSRPNMVSEESTVILPYSGTVASISCRYFQQSWPGDDRVWIVPDIPVTLTVADYRAGRDPLMDVVLRHARR